MLKIQVAGATFSGRSKIMTYSDAFKFHPIELKFLVYILETLRNRLVLYIPSETLQIISENVCKPFGESFLGLDFNITEFCHEILNPVIMMLL